MRILYTISCFASANTGQGGHYHSLKTLVRALARRRSDIDIRILSLGDFEPRALKDAPVPHDHFPVRLADLPTIGKRLAQRYRPTHVHAFDRRAFHYARSIAASAGARLYNTKPGGPNVRYFPFSEDIFVFSRENLAAFEGYGWGAQRPRFHFVPQRVTRPTIDLARVERLRARVGAGPLLLRIARIGSTYEQSIRQTLNLAAAIRAGGTDVRALIVGTIEEADALERIRAIADARDVIVTDDAFTRNAAELIPVADIVVGTGRGLMEAAMLGVPVLAPVNNATIPVLVTADNVAALQERNFSERSEVAIPAPAVVAAEVARLLTDTAAYRSRSAAIGTIAAQMFDIDAAVDTYLAAYDLAQTGRLPFKDRLVLLGGALQPLLGR